MSGEGRAFSAGHDLDSEEQAAGPKQLTEGLDGFGISGLSKDIYVDMMGFSTSVKAVGEYFIRTDPTRQTRQPGTPAIDARF